MIHWKNHNYVYILILFCLLQIDTKISNNNGLFEFYLSKNVGNVEIIKYLKFTLFLNNELLNPKLWTGNYLSKLRNIIKKKILVNKFECQKVLDYFPNGYRDNYIFPANGESDDVYLDLDDKLFLK